MPFEFVDPDKVFECKTCSAEIELWQYRRLSLCEECEAPVIARAKGSPEEQAERLLDTKGGDWDIAFLEDLNDWDDRRRRAR
jgi:hypothetical protein